MIRISYVNSTDYSYSSSTSCFWSLLACLRGVSCEVLCFCRLPCDECLALRSLYDRSHYTLKNLGLNTPFMIIFLARHSSRRRILQTFVSHSYSDILIYQNIIISKTHGFKDVRAKIFYSIDFF